MIRDKINKILDSLPEEELNEVYWSISYIQENYMFKKNLFDKGVGMKGLYDESEEIIEMWDKTFTQNISEAEKEEIYYEQYKWHIFSYKKQDCLIEEKARKAFDTMSKDEIYVMYEGSPIVSLYTNAKVVIAKDFDSQHDIYLFDKDFTWTYIHTHESMCGPYFYEVN
ncbi:DUF4275 family protein [Bacillus solimangrovi]|uniref:DUF4275 domain-containing protein n=1 Tax=Bacillus solimangrovi TaxID=1305675 RepID=A0A1E5LAM5_9BACI|nr:DUF4275 family protein [Bacillus solimangrovi]OEH91145.1 hypothetical protein BFG57_07180 [Bacillus solimangrovi]